MSLILAQIEYPNKGLERDDSPKAFKKFIANQGVRKIS